jgi:hypothetical protein
VILLHKLEELLEHSGVKGMHWGQRKDNHNLGTTAKEKSMLRKHLDSLKRERDWGKVLKEVPNMSTQDIKTVTARVKLENSLKDLTKSPMSTKKDKADYLRRGDMTDQELKRKIGRLQAKDNLHTAVKKASKQQREFGIKVAQTASSVGLKYAVTRTKLKPADFLDAYQNPTIKTRQNALDEAIKLVEPKATNSKAKLAIKAAKTIKFKTNNDKKS